MDPITIASAQSPQRQPNTSALKDAAKNLETVFIAEMLKSAGFGKTSADFGGGVGEDQFSSFLVDQHAKAISNGRGLGLAEHIFNAMRET